MLKIKKIKPMFNRILVTADKYENDVKQGGVVVVTAGTLKEYQKVISIGDTVRGIKEGDFVLINPARYAVKKHQEGSLKDGIISDNPVVSYNFNFIDVNGAICILLYDQDVDYVIQEYEEIEDKTPNLILPEEKKLILN
jgi:co-chaperonin GroES (HSP10)